MSQKEAKDNNEKVSNNVKKQKIKKKKKKSVIGRIFKIILLLLLVAIIVYVSKFAINYFKHTKTMEEDKVVYDPLSATALGIDPERLKEVGRINILVLGESDANQGRGKEPYYLTDTIMIVSYNPQTQQASILSIPRDTYVGKKDKKTASQNYLASYKINSVYRNRTNMEEAIERISEPVGIELKNYVMVDTEAIPEIVDAIGGVQFNVPIDMNYDDYNQDLHIHLQAGEQLIDGDKAEQLLRFRHNQDFTSYPAEYGDNDTGRMRTQREFIQETAKQLLRMENAGKIVNLLEIVFKNIRTNLDMQEMKYYIPYAFKFNTSNIVTDVLPGVPEECNGVWIYTANKEKTKQVVADLFTDKIVEEESENQASENTIGNEVTEQINDVESINEVTDNSIRSSESTRESENTANEIANTETKQEKQIIIELLNGTENQEILTKVKEQLKKEGYTISKSGTTTKTQKTMIINRTKQSSTVEKEIKDVLGVGTTTNGSDNAKVDFTIIIGEDYE